MNLDQESCALGWIRHEVTEIMTVTVGFYINTNLNALNRLRQRHASEQHDLRPKS